MMNPFILVLLFLFFTGVILFISGISNKGKNERVKKISITLGILLIFGTILVGIVVMIYALAYF